MPMRSRRPKPWMVVTAVVIAAFSATAAWAASIANPTNSGTQAGQGAAVIEGYNATAVVYTTATNAETSPSVVEVSAVAFNLFLATGTTPAPTSTTVYMQLRGTGFNGVWTSCTVGSAGATTCALTGAQRLPVADVLGISVVAYGS